MDSKESPGQAPPSYEDAARQPPHLSYLNHASSNRQERISRLIATRIEPFILAQAQAGLGKSALIVVPSNVASLAGKSKETYFFEQKPGNVDGADEKILGFPDDEAIRLTRLDDEQDTLEFWSQPRVIAELRERLRERVGTLEPPPPIAAPAPLPPRPDAKSEKKRFWKRSSSSSSPWDDKGISSIGAAATAAKCAGHGTASGEVTAEISAEEVSLRIVSDLGLYEVQCGRALVVRIRMDV